GEMWRWRSSSPALLLLENKGLPWLGQRRRRLLRLFRLTGPLYGGLSEKSAQSTALLVQTASATCPAGNLLRIHPVYSLVRRSSGVSDARMTSALCAFSYH